MEQNIQNVLDKIKVKSGQQFSIPYLVSELDPGPELVVHRHVGPRPPIGDVPHPLEVHVHNPGVEARVSVEGNLRHLLNTLHDSVVLISDVTLLRGVS